MNDGAWDRFFCGSCQTERPLSERVKVRGKLARCRSCAEKIRPPHKAKRVADVEVHESPQIPTEVMEAYREAME